MLKVEQDFEITISKDASKRLIASWPMMSQRILEYNESSDVAPRWKDILGFKGRVEDLDEGIAIFR